MKQVIRFYDSDSNPKYSLDVRTLTLHELFGSKGISALKNISIDI
jgi:hypothetical protein